MVAVVWGATVDEMSDARRVSRCGHAASRAAPDPSRTSTGPGPARARARPHRARSARWRDRRSAVCSRAPPAGPPGPRSRDVGMSPSSSSSVEAYRNPWSGWRDGSRCRSRWSRGLRTARGSRARAFRHLEAQRQDQCLDRGAAQRRGGIAIARRADRQALVVVRRGSTGSPGGVEGEVHPCGLSIRRPRSTRAISVAAAGTPRGADALAAGPAQPGQHEGVALDELPERTPAGVGDVAPCGQAAARPRKQRSRWAPDPARARHTASAGTQRRGRRVRPPAPRGEARRSSAAGACARVQGQQARQRPRARAPARARARPAGLSEAAKRSAPSA